MSLSNLKIGTFGNISLSSETTLSVPTPPSLIFSLEQFGKSLKTVDFSEDFKKKLDNGVKLETVEDDGLITVTVGGVFYAIASVNNGLIAIVARDK